MGNTGTANQFSFKRRNPVRPSDGDVDGGRRRSGTEETNDADPGIRGRRLDAIGIDHDTGPAPDGDGIGERIFGDLGYETEARNLGTDAADAPRKRGRPKGSRNRTTVDPSLPRVTGQQVEKYTVSTFGLIANVTKRPHWRVEKPEYEVRPWAEDAASLINSLPVQYVEAVSKYSALFAVALGLGGMVYIRMRLDAELIGETRRQRQPKPNPNANRMQTDDDIRQTGGEPVGTADVEIPTTEGATISQDNLMRIWQYQTQTAEPGTEQNGTGHRYGRGGAEPLTPKNLSGILA